MNTANTNSPRRRRLGLVWLLLLYLPLLTIEAQTRISGRVTSSEDGSPIPHAGIYLTRLKSGSVCSDTGDFSILIPPGRHEIEIRSVGYHTQRFTLEVADQELSGLSFQLRPQVYQLNELKVEGVRGKEDPAYPIMRRVMYRVPLYRRMIKSYELEAFLRGTTWVDKVASFAKGIRIGEGEVRLKDLVGKTFVDEMHMRLNYEAPQSYKQHIFARRSSSPKEFGMDLGGEGGLAHLIRQSPYEGLATERMANILSPITPEAYNIYRYHLRGRTLEQEQVVYHIDFEIRDSSKDEVSGSLEIIGDSWALRRISLRHKQPLGIYQEIQYNLSEIEPGIMMPTTYSQYITANLLGFKAGGKFFGSVKYSKISLSEEGKRVQELLKGGAPKSKELTSKRLRQHEREIASRYSPASKQGVKRFEVKPEESSEVKISLDSLATRRDSLYWQRISPIPMQRAELQSFAQRDSIDEAIRRRPGHRNVSQDDSTASRELRLLYPSIMGGTIYGGSQYRLSMREGLANHLLSHYNSVNALTLGSTLELRRFRHKSTLWQLQAGLGYSLSKHTWDWHTRLILYPDNKHNAWLSLSAGDQIVELGQRRKGYSSLLNASYTAMDGQGVAELYRERHLMLEGGWLPSKYLKVAMGIGLEEAHRAEMRHLKGITSSFVGNFGSWDGAQGLAPSGSHYAPITPGSVAHLYLSAEWNPTPYHRVHSNEVTSYVSAGTHSPLIAAGLEGVRSTSGEVSDYLLLRLRIKQRLQLARHTSKYLSYYAQLNSYLWRERLARQHQIYLHGSGGLVQSNAHQSTFYTLAPYSTATEDLFAQAGLSYEASRILINYLKLPLLRLSREELSLKAYYGLGGQPYLEAGYSITFGPLARLGFYYGRSLVGEGQGASLVLNFDL